MMVKPLSLQDGEGDALWSDWSGRLHANAAVERLAKVLIKVDDDGNNEYESGGEGGSTTCLAHHDGSGCVDTARIAQ